MVIFGLFASFKKFFSDQKDGSSPNQQSATNSFTSRESLSKRQMRHRQDALSFVKQSHQEIKRQKHKEDIWERNFAKQKAKELSQLSGKEFETFLAGLFRRLGYQVEITPVTGDYGADLILNKLGEKVAVQAKCYSGSVGVSAVQEVLAGMHYYKCQSAWVVTTGNLTQNAIELAKKSNVKLIDSNELGKIIRQIQTNTSNG